MFEEIRRHQELQKANILRGFGINSQDELELEIFKAQETDIEKAKHQVGDVHPNGKWVWVQLPNGRFDWRTSGGRAHKRHDEAQKNKEGEKSESREAKTTEEHAADTSTETLKKVAATPAAPKKLKDAAKKELSERSEGGDENSGNSERTTSTSNSKTQYEDRVKKMSDDELDDEYMELDRQQHDEYLSLRNSKYKDEYDKLKKEHDEASKRSNDFYVKNTVVEQTWGAGPKRVYKDKKLKAEGMRLAKISNDCQKRLSALDKKIKSEADSNFDWMYSILEKEEERRKKK